MNAPASPDAPPDFSRRIPQLDGLRGIAIALVLVYHYAGNVVDFVPPYIKPFVQLGGLGWSGVDLFFVLSGFLIGGILLDARGSSNYFRVFYWRRICRIFPLYFAFLAAFYVVSHFQHWPELDTLFNPQIPWQVSVTFNQNLWMAVHNELGAMTLHPTWSLAVEEQFYLTLPAIILLVKGRRLLYLLGCGIVAAPLFRLILFLVRPQDYMATYVLLPCRMDSLLLGVVTAYLLRAKNVLEFARAHRRHLWTVIEVLTVICGLFTVRASPHDPVTMLIGVDCLGLLFTCVLVASLLDESLANVLRTKWLMGLGTIAYGVYMFHQPAFGFAAVLLRSYTTNWAVTTVLSLLLTIAAAKASWEWFEKPIVNFGRRKVYVRPMYRPEVTNFDHVAESIAGSAVELNDAV